MFEWQVVIANYTIGLACRVLLPRSVPAFCSIVRCMMLPGFSAVFTGVLQRRSRISANRGFSRDISAQQKDISQALIDHKYFMPMINLKDILHRINPPTVRNTILANWEANALFISYTIRYYCSATWITSCIHLRSRDLSHNWK
jgi:hypothetical protein